LNGEYFGLVRCNIETPEKLKDYFSELPPIFKNIKVSRDDIGDHIKEYCLKQNILNQSRRSLISSFHGTDILLATPLLRWYLKKGLVVTDIIEIVEYRGERCFERFGNTVSDARRQGDLNPDSSILADTMKLVGNR
jgi:hypothetical protein